MDEGHKLENLVYSGGRREKCEVAEYKQISNQNKITDKDLQANMYTLTQIIMCYKYALKESISRKTLCAMLQQLASHLQCCKDRHYLCYQINVIICYFYRITQIAE